MLCDRHPPKLASTSGVQYSASLGPIGWRSASADRALRPSRSFAPTAGNLPRFSRSASLPPRQSVFRTPSTLSDGAPSHNPHGLVPSLPSGGAPPGPGLPAARPLTSGCISECAVGTWNRSISSIMVPAGERARGRARPGTPMRPRGAAAPEARQMMQTRPP